MKNIKIFAIASLALLYSCDYLDTEPTGRVIASKVSEYRALLTEGYQVYPRNNGRSYTALLSDELGGLVTSNFVGMDTRNGTPLNYTWQYTPNMYEYNWMDYYTAIFQANAVIEGIAKAPENSDESRNQVWGEAHALRAYAHFELTNLYGKWYDESTAATDKTAPIADHIDIGQSYKPSTVAKMYGHILADIKQAKELMDVEKQTTVSLNYRFSKNAIAAFEARVMLYMGKCQEAYDLAKPLISAYKLKDLNDVPDIKKATDLPWQAGSPEAILALDRPFGAASGDFVNMVALLSDDFLNLFDAKDNRLNFMKELTEFSMETFEDEVLGTVLIRKASDRSSLRVAEMYLIAAEGAARINTPDKIAEAKTLLKDLMQKRLKPEGYEAKATAIDAMSQEALLTEIANERAREFPLEGHRWFDLRRTTRPQITKKYDNQTYTLIHNDTRYTLPFPYSAIENNPNLKN